MRVESDARVESPAPLVEIRDLGRMEYAEAFALQQQLVERRKRGEIPDQLLFVEHPHVVTMGRSAHDENLLASPALLERSGIAYHTTDQEQFNKVLGSRGVKRASFANRAVAVPNELGEIVKAIQLYS